MNAAARPYTGGSDYRWDQMTAHFRLKSLIEELASPVIN